MHILDRRTLLKAAGAALACAQASRATASVGLEGARTFTSDANGTFVDSVLILGDEAAVLVDAQLDRANANALGDVVSASGRQLETIIITHVHPDHLMGLDVLLTRFPTARAVAHPALQPVLAEAGPVIFSQLKQIMGAALAERLVVPEPLAGDTLRLEGERIDLLPPMHGDTPLITPVWIEALGTLVTSDIVFSGTHLYVAENTASAQIDAWRESLDALEAMAANTIIPGHRISDEPGPAAFAHTRTYLAAWQASLEDTQTPADLRAALLERVGDLPVPFFVDRAIAAIHG